MLELICISLAIVIIAITITVILRRTRLVNLIYSSDGQTQTNISTQTIEELNKTALELQRLNTAINKQATTMDKLLKDINTIYYNVTAQQASLDFLNKYTADNLQTIVDAVQQLVHIAQKYPRQYTDLGTENLYPSACKSSKRQQ